MSIPLTLEVLIRSWEKQLLLQIQEMSTLPVALHPITPTNLIFRSSTPCSRHLAAFLTDSSLKSILTTQLPFNTSLVFATYFGGNGSDGIAGIALDNSENIYVTGSTSSSNLPGASVSTIQSAFGGTYDAFAAKINAAGTAIVYSTYLGGNRSDFGKAIAVNAGGNVFVAGDVMPPSSGTYNFPLVHPIQGTPGGGQYDVFAAKINAAGTALDYSTFLGGALSDRAMGIAVDSQGSAFVAGVTESADYPVKNPISGHDHILGDTGREVDGFVTRLSPLGTTFIYSTFLGG